MKTITLYHGTSEANAKKIEKEGFITDKSYNWEIKSKKGFVYLSYAYAPFYAMKHNTNKLAIIKVEVPIKNCFPEDDFIMYAMGKPRYTQEELNSINLKDYKHLWKESLEYLGNIAVKPRHIKILGIKMFDGKSLIMKCDPVITPMNYKIMGEYYKELSEHIYQGKKIMDFKGFMEELK